MSLKSQSIRFICPINLSLKTLYTSLEYKLTAVATIPLPRSHHPHLPLTFFISFRSVVKVHWEDPEESGREGVGGGIRMGNTCKSMADSCQCMTKTTTIL